MTQITGHSQTSRRILRIACHLILGSITNQSLCVCKSDIRWSSSVALVVGNDLHSIVLPHTNAAWFIWFLVSNSQGTQRGDRKCSTVNPQIAISIGKTNDNPLELVYRSIPGYPIFKQAQVSSACCEFSSLPGDCKWFQDRYQLRSSWPWWIGLQNGKRMRLLRFTFQLEQHKHQDSTSRKTYTHLQTSNIQRWSTINLIHAFQRIQTGNC